MIATQKLLSKFSLPIIYNRNILNIKNKNQIHTVPYCTRTCRLHRATREVQGAGRAAPVRATARRARLLPRARRRAPRPESREPAARCEHEHQTRRYRKRNSMPPDTDVQFFHLQIQ